LSDRSAIADFVVMAPSWSRNLHLEGLSTGPVPGWKSLDFGAAVTCGVDEIIEVVVVI
jgi:hypothetical protein